jgi:hypothetical protein
MKKHQTVIGLLVFMTIIGFSALIGWLSGYNFDERGDGVAFWAAYTLVAAVALGGMAATFPDL